jgi:subtilisin family serine protease
MQFMHLSHVSLRHLAPWATLILLTTATTPSVAARPLRDFLQNDPNATNRLIIRLRPHTRMRAGVELLLSRLAAQPLTLVRHLPDGARVYRLRAQIPLPYARNLARKIAQNPNVLFAEPDTRLRLDSAAPSLRLKLPGGERAHAVPTPNDPLFANQWNLTNPVVGINAPGAWAMTTGASSVTVAVLDSGVMMSHTDLHDRLVAGYDFVDNDMDPTDKGEGTIQWHGSGTASIIGAVTNNNAGMAGVNWTSPILAVRIGTGSGAYSSDMADGIYWAAGLPVKGTPTNKTPARVLNVSFNGHGPCPASVQQAINAARARGAVIVVAAGNYNQDVSNTQPGNCRGVITVGATDSGGNRAPFSNYGSGVTVAAPGTSLITAASDVSPWSTSNSGYLIRSGTSFAAPEVAGIVSLMLSVNPALTPDDVESILRTAVRAYPRYANCTGICHTGIINAQAAVWLAAPDAVKVPKPVLPAPLATGRPAAGGASDTAATSGSADHGDTGTPPATTTPGNTTGSGAAGAAPSAPGATGTPAAPPTNGQSGTGNAPASTGNSANPFPANGNATSAGGSSPTAGNFSPAVPPVPVSGSTPAPVTKPNLAKFVRAIAGANQTVTPGSRVTLRGIGQADSTARIISYKWVQLAGPTVQLSNSHAAQAVFTAPMAYTTLTFRLIVIDNRGHAAAADTNVTMKKPPVSVSSRPVAKPTGSWLFSGWW